MAENQVILNADVVFDATKIQQRFSQLERNLKFQNPFGAMNRDVTNFSFQLDRATQRVITLGTAFSVLATANRLIRDIVTSTVQVEKAMTGVNTIFKLTNESLNRFSSSLFDISRDTATSFDKVAEAAQEFARQGLSVAETQKAVRAALLLSRDANIDVAESVKAITSATNSFNKEALSRLQIVNRLASVDAAFAVSSKDLSEALIRSGSAAADAGVSFNQFIGLVTAAQQISQRGGSVIAGALNTIFTRINRKDTLDALDSLGIAITDIRGQALPTIQVLQNFAVAYDKMTGSIKNQAAELVGGVRQLNTLKATLKDLAQQGSVFAQVQDIIARNTNEIERRNAARNQTLSALGSQAATTGQQIGSNAGALGFAGPVKSIISSTLNNPVTQALAEANGNAESMGGKIAEGFLRGFGASVIFGLGPILLKVLATVSTQVTGNLLRDVMAITSLNTEEKQRATIEAEIVALYKSGGVALQQQLATMTSLAQRAELVRGLLTGAGAAVTPVGPLASEVIAQGGVPRRPRLGFAGGYLPYSEESMAIAAGVGGAPAGARPVLLPSFNFGGGKVGPIVANTSEYLVPHFAGGSAIFNQNMAQKFGLPPGARPIAAGGYVPNAAGGNLRSSIDIAMGSNLPNSGTPATAYDAALARISPDLAALDAQEKAWEKALAQFQSETQARLSKRAAENAMRARDFKRAEAEIIEQIPSKSEANSSIERSRRELALQKSSQIEEAYAQLEKEKGLVSAKATLTRSEIKQGEQAAAAIQTIYQQARIRGQVARAKIGGFAESAVFIPKNLGYEDASTAPQPATMGEVRDYTRNLNQRFRRPTAYYNPDTIAINEAFMGMGSALTQGPRLPPGWTPPATVRSSFSRFGSNLYNRANSPGGSLLLGFGLPFAGGAIGEGQGGTTGGMARTAASYGLQGAGFGATVGSLIGPEGTLVGAALGGVVGALGGAITKVSKSLDELALEIDQKNKKFNEETNKVVNIFQQQEELQNALSSQNTDRVVELRAEMAASMSELSAKDREFVKSNLTRPDAAVDYLRGRNSIAIPQKTQDNVTRSFAPGKFTFSKFLAGMFAYDPTTEEEIGTASDSLKPLLSGLSQSQLNQVQQMNGRNPKQAFSMIGRLGGMSPEDIGKTTEFLDKDFLRDAITDALHRMIGQNPAGNRTVVAQLQNTALARDTDLIQQAADYKLRARFLAISGGADRQITSVQQQIALANPALTDVSRLGLQGLQGASNISVQIANQRSIENFTGLSQLTDIARTKGLSQQIINRLKLMPGNLAGFERLNADLSTPAGRAPFQSVGLGDQNSPFRKTLTDLIDKLKELDDTEAESIRANNEGNALLRAQLNEQKSFRGAQKEITGSFLTTQQNVQSAISRRDPIDVIEAARGAARASDLNALRFYGLLNDQQFGTGLLNLQSNQAFGQRQRNFEYSQGRGANARVSDLFRNSNLSASEQLQSASDAAALARLNRDPEEEIRNRDIQLFNLRAQQRVSLGLGYTERQSRLDMARNAAKLTRNGMFTTGSQVTAQDFGVAQELGMQGNALGSLSGGFHAVFAGLKKDMNDFSAVGKSVADALNSTLGNAFGDFVTGAKRGKDAFRGFVVSVLGDTSRLLSSKIISGLLASIPGFGASSGGPMGFAGGGMVPAMLTGGEYVIGPNAARRIGYDTLRRMNMADGGLVSGGSGVKDDIPARLAPGSFVLKKSATQRIGPDYLNAMMNGQVQYRAGGGLMSSFAGLGPWGILLGAAVGGGLGYLAGGKKGAIGGALLGGVGASLLDSSGVQMDPTTGQRAVLSIGEKTVLGLGAAGGLGLLAAGIQGDHSSSALNDSQLNGYRQRTEAAQATSFAGRPSPYPILQVGPQGQQYISGFTDGPATRRWAEGGGVDVPLTVNSAQAKSSGGAAAVTVKIDIHNNGTTTASSSASDGGQGAFQGEFANKLQKTVQGLVQQELVNQSRSDGFFAQRSRYLQR